MSSLFSTRGVGFLDIICYPDLDFQAGRHTFLRGESGSGKSTLLKLLNGTLSPTAGSVYYKGEDVAWMDTLTLRRQAILVAQDAWLFPGSVRENFASYRAFRGEQPVGDEEMAQLLHICAADVPLEADTATLSGGERQRVFLATCLSFCPEALLMDEPTSALDEQTAHTLFSRLGTCAKERGMTLITISHAQALSDSFADEVITLNGREEL